MAGPGPTRIHAVVDKLIDISGEATGLQVLDGPHVGEVMLEALCVGFTDGPDRPGYTVDVSRQQGMGRPRLQEDFTVRVLMTITSGDTDMATLRSRAAALIGQLDTALRDDVVVDGVWDRAVVGGAMDWIPIQHEQGATCNVIFTVEGSGLL